MIRFTELKHAQQWAKNVDPCFCNEQQQIWPGVVLVIGQHCHSCSTLRSGIWKLAGQGCISLPGLIGHPRSHWLDQRFPIDNFLGARPGYAIFRHTHEGSPTSHTTEFLSMKKPDIAVARRFVVSNWCLSQYIPITRVLRDIPWPFLGCPHFEKVSCHSSFFLGGGRHFFDPHYIYPK